jgi:hypothetical protein
MLPVYKYMFICVQHTIMLRNKSRVFYFNREIMSLQFCVHVLASRPATLSIVRQRKNSILCITLLFYSHGLVVCTSLAVGK